jgi:hypothetical protein
MVIDAQGLGADVIGPERHHPIKDPFDARAATPGDHQVPPIVKPDLEHEHGHQVPQVDEPEHRHRRFAMRCDVHLVRSLGMTEMHLQRQRGDQKKGQGRQQRKSIRRLHRGDVEDAFERRQDEGASHQSCEERVEHDEDAPLELDLVGIDEAGDVGHVSPSAH